MKTSKVSEVANTPGGATWERERIERAKAGDRQAYGELLRHYEARIFSLVLRWVGRSDEAHEITQEAFLIAFRDQHRFDVGRPFRPWLFKIAINVCRNHRRRRRPEGELPSDIENALWQVDGRDGEATAISAEEGAAIRRAMQRVDPETRNLLLLRFFEDMSYEELATVYARPAALLKVRVHRAVKRLRQVIESRP